MAITIRWQDSEYGELIKVRCRMCKNTDKYGITLGRGMDKNNLFDSFNECEKEIYRKYGNWKTFKVYENYRGGFFNKK